MKSLIELYFNHHSKVSDKCEICLEEYKNKMQLWIPESFVHGFLTLSEAAEFLYKITCYIANDYVRAIHRDDKACPIGLNPVILGKNAIANGFKTGEMFT